MHVNLEDAHTSRRRGFANLEEMMTFLRSRLEGEGEPEGKNEKKGE